MAGKEVVIHVPNWAWRWAVGIDGGQHFSMYYITANMAQRSQRGKRKDERSAGDGLCDVVWL